MFNLIFFGALFLIILISTIVGYFRGFLKTVAGFVVYIFSFYIAYSIAPFVSKYVKLIPFIKNMITDVSMPSIDESATISQRLLEMVKYVALNSMNNDENVKAISNNYLAEILSTIIAFIGTFIIVLLLLKILVKLLHTLLAKVGLGGVNKVFGLITGFLLGLFITWMISNGFVKFVLPILSVNYPDVVSASIGESSLMKFFMNFNPISLIMNLLIK